MRLTITAAPDGGQAPLPFRPARRATNALARRSSVSLACDLLPGSPPWRRTPEFAPSPRRRGSGSAGARSYIAEAGGAISLKVRNVRVTPFRDTSSYRLLDPT